MLTGQLIFLRIECICLQILNRQTNERLQGMQGTEDEKLSHINVNLQITHGALPESPACEKIYVQKGRDSICVCVCVCVFVFTFPL